MGVTFEEETRRSVTAILNGPNASEQFSSVRYPYTYADDFVRSHFKDFGFSEMPSRSEVSMWLIDKCDNQAEHREVLMLLAQSYLKEHHIEP